MVSYGAEASSLSDREKYPYFFRTIPPINHHRYVNTTTKLCDPIINFLLIFLKALYEDLYWKIYKHFCFFVFLYEVLWWKIIYISVSLRSQSESSVWSLVEDTYIPLWSFCVLDILMFLFASFFKIKSLMYFGWHTLNMHVMWLVYNFNSFELKSSTWC